MTLRFSDHEFQRSGGLRDDAWPIRYGDIRPYYDEVERFIGIEGKSDGVARLPDGVYLPASRMTPLEAQFRERVETRWHDRRVIHARGVRGHSNSGESMNDSAWAPHTSLHSVLPSAIATGRTELRPDAIVSHLLLSDDGSRVVGVACVDRESRKQFEIYGRAVALCASTLESVRIMLNSTHPRHPTGVGDSSGCLGSFIVDHAAVSVSGECAGKVRELLFALGPGSGYGILMPPIAENFGIWGAFQRGAPNAAGELGWFLNATVEMSPRRSNRVMLDECTVDAWGIKSLKMDVRYSDEEREELAYARRYLCHMAEVTGLKVTGGVETAPGGYVHELGGARMGSDPATSVLNEFNQCWDVPNLYVMDGSSFVTAGWQNPSLTIMALAVRASAHLAESLKRQES